MQRYGQIIKIKKEKIQKYKNLHAKPYEGVCEMIKECNIQNYSNLFVWRIFICIF